MSRATSPKSRPLRLEPPAGAGADSLTPYRSRLTRLGQTLVEKDLAAALITNPKDVGYLSGFLSGDSYLLVPAEVWRSNHKPLLITDFRYQEEVEPLRDAGLIDLWVRTNSMVEAVVELLGSPSETLRSTDDPETHESRAESAARWAWTTADARIGIQAEHMSVALKAALGRRIVGGVKRLIDTTSLLTSLRAVKDDIEIGHIRKAVSIQESALKAVLPHIKPGITESHLAALLEMEMKSRGSAEPGFPTIVASGPSASKPHYQPSNRKLSKSASLLIDWGATSTGYHSDMTRCFAFSKWPGKIEEIYKVVLDAHLAAAQALKPGVSPRKVDSIARKVIEQAGFGDFFGHGLGHGLGLDGHEDPRLTNMLSSPNSSKDLLPNMVVTIEPGIYLPGVGGVRLEDDYLITDTGAQCLSSLPKTLDWALL